MDDRRPLIAIALIMLIAFAPLLLRKPKPVVPPPTAGALQPSAGFDTVAGRIAPSRPLSDPVRTGEAPVAPATPERVIPVRSKLYRYAVSTRGGRVVSSRFLSYPSLAAADHRDTLELVPPGDGLLAGHLIVGSDTVRLESIAFTADADSLNALGTPAVLTLTGNSGAYNIRLTYTFAPDDYHFRVKGSVTGLGPTGATLLVSLGNGFRQTEANAPENYRESGIVTKTEKTKLLRFGSLKPLQVTTLSGPFEWVAMKSKYFVVGVFAIDSTAAKGSRGRVNGALAYAPDSIKTPYRASVAASVTVPASGAFEWTVYLGPMEYDRLTRMGNDFDDVNPYGWSWIRWAVRPFAIVIRGLFVGMHHALGVGYGLVIVAFGILVRILLWPLNQKAMRSMMAMQALQPQLTEMQQRYKEDPQRLQQETLRLYKENNVNPFGGCWPMLLPYPLLVAVFFVLAYTIEVRGVPFLWMPDLSRADPLYIIPVVMAIGMFAVSKISQLGMPPNPQAKMMLYLMPAMMLIFFANFASGLNLYYAVQNLASLPQQWMVMKERRKMMAMATAPVVVNKRK